MSTNQEILDELVQHKTYEQVKDGSIDRLLQHLDSLFEKQYGVDGSYSIWCGLKPGSPDAGYLVEFLKEFEEANPHLCYWFSWAPFRGYMPEYWEIHRENHNAKVRREYTTEEANDKNGLFI